MDVAQSHSLAIFLDVKGPGVMPTKLNTACRPTVENIAGESLVHLDSDVPLRFFSSSSNVGGEA